MWRSSLPTSTNRGRSPTCLFAFHEHRRRGVGPRWVDADLLAQEPRQPRTVRRPSSAGRPGRGASELDVVVERSLVRNRRGAEDRPLVKLIDR